MRNFIICTLYEILLGIRIKEDDVNRTCSIHGRDGKYIQNISQRTGREQTYAYMLGKL
jgi:hypothetical protein